MPEDVGLPFIRTQVRGTRRASVAIPALDAIKGPLGAARRFVNDARFLHLGKQTGPPASCGVKSRDNAGRCPGLSLPIPTDLEKRVLAIGKALDGLGTGGRWRLARADEAPGATIPPRAAPRTHDQGKLGLGSDERVASGSVRTRSFGYCRASAALAVAVGGNLGAGDIVPTSLAAPSTCRPFPDVASTLPRLSDGGRPRGSGHVLGGGGET